MFSSRKIILLLFLVLMGGTIYATYNQLYGVPFSFNNRPCDSNETPYKTIKTQPIISLGKDEKFDLLYVEENLNTLDQKDPQLIQYTRVRHLTPPSKQPYNFRKPLQARPDVFSTFVAELFGNKRNGVFIEAGANDGGESSGTSISHSLYLELTLGWTGLLVECNPKVVPYLRTKHRKAWIADVCLSPTGHAETVSFF